MNKSKLYIDVLKILKSTDTLNEYEIANKLFKTKRADHQQIRVSYELTEELLNKGYINKNKLVKSSSISEKTGNIFETIDNRFSITLDGLNYLKENGNSFTTWITANKVTITILTTIIALILTAIKLFM